MVLSDPENHKKLYIHNVMCHGKFEKRLYLKKLLKFIFKIHFYF